jgi:hypothetical protein
MILNQLERRAIENIMSNPFPHAQPFFALTTEELLINPCRAGASSFVLICRENEEPVFLVIKWFVEPFWEDVRVPEWPILSA